MRRTIALVLTLALLLTAFAGCVKKDADRGEQAANVSESGTPDTTAPATPDTTAPATTDAQAEALYVPIIEKYREAFSNFNVENYDLEINRLLVDYYCNDSVNTVGYAICDIDRDGTTELMIGAKDAQDPEQMPLEGLAGIYTLKDGTPNWLIGSDYECASVCVLKEGTILKRRTYWGQQIKTGSVDTVYEIKDGELSAQKTYFGVEDYDETGDICKVTLSYSVDGLLPVDGDDEVLLDQMQPIDPEEYQAAMAAFNGEVMTLPITLFSAQDTNAPAS
ncbi:MAG: hypothetical protein IKN72_07335 [Clostridia bacterium]|nr:hypothetical protein [Clostridia bacterium]